MSKILIKESELIKLVEKVIRENMSVDDIQLIKNVVEKDGGYAPHISGICKSLNEFGFDCKENISYSDPGFDCSILTKNGETYVLADSEYVTDADFTINRISGGRLGKIKPTWSAVWKKYTD